MPTTAAEGGLVRLELPGRWEPGPARPSWPGDALAGWTHAHVLERHPDRAKLALCADQQAPLAAALLGGPSPTLVFCGYGPLADAIAALAEDPPERLLLGDRWWQRTGRAVVQVGAWSGLARPLLATPPAGRVRLDFLSPTTLPSPDGGIPWPNPDLVFGGLLARWQRWSGIDLGEGVAPALAAHARLRRFHLRSAPVRAPAFLGWAEWSCNGAPPEYGGLAELLARFAEFAGVGERPQRGFGCVQRRALPPPATAGFHWTRPRAAGGA